MYGSDNGFRSGKEGILESRTVRNGCVRGREPPGIIEESEGSLGDGGQYLAGPSPGARTLFYDHQTTSFLD